MVDELYIKAIQIVHTIGTNNLDKDGIPQQKGNVVINGYDCEYSMENVETHKYGLYALHKITHNGEIVGMGVNSLLLAIYVALIILDKKYKSVGLI